MSGNQRTNLISYIDSLPEFGERRAYVWKEGVRWRSRSFLALHGRILACAATLQKAGVRQGEAVLIQGPDTPDWVEAFMGVLWAGGVAVPLEVGTTDGFRARVARVSEARLLIASPGDTPPDNVTLVPLGSWPDRTSGTPPRTEATPDTRAEIVFTSGSTGDPKGVVLTHGNLTSDFAPIEAVIRKRHRWIKMIGTLPFISTLPLSHMFGQALNIFLPTFIGLTIVFTRPRPRDVREAARRHRAWGLFTVPRLLEVMTDDVRRQLRRIGKLERLEQRHKRLADSNIMRQTIASSDVVRMFGWKMRMIIVGGAALRRAAQEFWLRCGYFVVQGYGLTETAPIVTLSNPFKRSAGHVGKPLRGVEMKLGPGNEILVRGPNVTSGYLGQDEAAPDEWFATGDVGEIDQQGQLHIRGRIKDVIVTAEGENVYPGDVEQAFEGAPGVREVCVIGLPFDDGDRVHAVLLVDEGTDAAAIVEAANRGLAPKQRIQGHTIWPEDDLPRTHTGKVRKIAVVEQVLSMRGEAGTTATGAAPADKADFQTLVAEVARVPVNEIKPETTLIDGLGLTSLDLVELTVAVEERFGVRLPEEELNRATVGDIEKVLKPVSITASARPATRAAPQHQDSAATGTLELSTGPGELRMPRWARRFPVRHVRRLLQEILYRPFLGLFARTEVRGLEHLIGTPPPYLFVANHHSHFDAGLFMTALPPSVRGKIAPAMTTRHHRLFFGESEGGVVRYAAEWIQVRLVQFLFNAWPLPETAGITQSLDYAGELADAGCCLLIFPEGRHTPEGTLEQFRKGIGIFARELRAPVIPAFIEGTGDIFPSRAWWPRFGKARLTLGAPLFVSPDEEPAKVAEELESAVRRLKEAKG